MFSKPTLRGFVKTSRLSGFAVVQTGRERPTQLYTRREKQLLKAFYGITNTS
jgi:hypothetical protein